MEKENSYTNDYLLDRQVKILQPVDGYRASTDAVFLSSLVDGKKIKEKPPCWMSVPGQERFRYVWQPDCLRKS